MEPWPIHLSDFGEETTPGFPGYAKGNYNHLKMKLLILGQKFDAYSIFIFASIHISQVNYVPAIQIFWVGKCYHYIQNNK